MILVLSPRRTALKLFLKTTFLNINASTEMRFVPSLASPNKIETAVRGSALQITDWHCFAILNFYTIVYVTKNQSSWWIGVGSRLKKHQIPYNVKAMHAIFFDFNF